LAQVKPDHVCCCHHQDNHCDRHHHGIAPASLPVYPLVPTVTPPSATVATAAANSMGIRLEAAPPVTVVDMPTILSPFHQEFSSHPRPTIVTIIPDSKK
jgi:hypothetical protein